MHEGCMSNAQLGALPLAAGEACCHLGPELPAFRCLPLFGCPGEKADRSDPHARPPRPLPEF
eukprot:918573-Alexandrium_andersonii.AAC.1